MKIETIIHYNQNNLYKDIFTTLDSMQKTNSVPDEIRLCFNPPININQSLQEFQDLVKWVFGAHTIKCHIQIFTSHFDSIGSVINQSAEISTADHYVFVNAGYKFQTNEIISEIRNGRVIFSDAVDDQMNEFSCKTKLHKLVGGFGKKNSLQEKIEYRLKMLEDAKNAAEAKLAEGGSDNL
jgi:hypothetical protein